MQLKKMREQISSSIKITEQMADYFNIEPKNGRAVCDCPFCQAKGMFAISDIKNTYKCFSCNDENDIIGFVAKYEHISLKEACKKLSDKIGITYHQGYTEKQMQMFEANRKAAILFHKALYLNREAQMYFKERGLKRTTVKRFGLGFADKEWSSLERSLFRHGVSKDIMKEAGLITVKNNGHSYDRFRNRVIFPIIDEDNKVIGFGGRIIKKSDKGPKYLNTSTTEVFNKSGNLFALNFAKDSKREGLILCEGYMDVISLHQAGYDNAVASLGTAFTTEHAYLLRQYTDKVYLSFDTDEAGIRAKMKAIPMLRNAGLDVRVLNVYPYKDPDEFIKANGRKAFQEVLDKAETSYHYEVRCWASAKVRQLLRIHLSFQDKMKDVLARATATDRALYEEAYNELVYRKREQEAARIQQDHTPQQRQNNEFSQNLNLTKIQYTLDTLYDNINPQIASGSNAINNSSEPDITNEEKEDIFKEVTDLYEIS